MPTPEIQELLKPQDMPSVPARRGERLVDGHGAVSERDSRELANYTYSPETAQRCRIVLLADAGWADVAIADQVGVSTETVLQWKQRFEAEGIAGLIGWPATSRAALGHRRRTGVAEIIRTSLAESALSPSQPVKARVVAEQVNVEVAAVVRAWLRYGIAPHRAGGWMFRVQPPLVATLAELVGAFISPQVNVMAVATHPSGGPTGTGRLTSSSAAGSNLAEVRADAIQSLSASEPIAEQLGDFLREIRQARSAPVHLVTDNPSAFARWRSLGAHTRNDLTAHLAGNVQTWWHLLEVAVWMQSPGTSHGSPLADSLRSHHDGGGRCRWLAEALREVRSPADSPRQNAQDSPTGTTAR